MVPDGRGERGSVCLRAGLQWNFANEGGFGCRYRVLKNIMGLWLLQRITQEFQIPIDDALLNAIADAAPWRSIVNPDDARFLNPDSMKQAIADYCAETRQPAPETPAQFARCALESLALTYRLVKEQLESLRGQEPDQNSHCGRRHEKSPAQSTMRQRLPVAGERRPGGGIRAGNICSQMIALGEIPSLDAARALIRQLLRDQRVSSAGADSRTPYGKNFSNLLRQE